MSSIKLCIELSLEQQQFPKSSSDSPLSNLEVMSTSIRDGLRTRAESQPDDNYPRLNCKFTVMPTFSSDAPNQGNSPQRSEKSIILSIQLNMQNQVQHDLVESLEKKEEVEMILHIQQVEQPEFCLNFL